MAEEQKQELKENKKAEIKPEEKQDAAKGKGQEMKKEIKEDKIEEKKETKKVEKAKKDYALVNGKDLHISTKEAADVCSMIRRRNIDSAIKMIEEVIAFKRVVHMNKREVPHQHGKGVMAGRYPINAAKEFLRLLKLLKANALHNELEFEKYVIFCKADKASQPYKRGGARFKRSHVMLRLIKKKEEKKAETKQKSEKKKKNGREKIC